jgi:phage tail protein X
MKSAILFGSIFSLVSTLAIANPGLSGNSPSELLRRGPNVTFPVSSKFGKCPKEVKLWAHSRNYEGGGEWTVIANTSAIARPATLVSKNRKVAVFRAFLKPHFRSCRGVAVSGNDEFSPYRFQFQNGRVFFRVTLPKNTPSNPSAIVQARTVQSRPLVRWQIAD